MKHILSRLLMLAVVMFGVTLLTFFYTSLSPVDAAQALAVRRYTRPTDEQITEVRHELGLDRPFASQYINWLGNAVRGDFGDSYNTGKPIIEELSASMRPTFAMALMSLVFTALLSIPLGVLSAARRGGFADKTVYLFGIVCMSVPNYWIGFMLMIVFAVNIPLFSIMGADSLKDLVLPSLAIAIPTAAANIRVFRSSLIEGYNSDFVLYARARGISEARIAGMVNRFALPPLITLLGQSFGFTIAGSAMIEFVFSIPGVGSMLVTALSSRDTVTVNACVLVIAAIFVAVNFLAEVVNTLIDPTRRSKEGAYAEKTAA